MQYIRYPAVKTMAACAALLVMAMSPAVHAATSFLEETQVEVPAPSSANGGHFGNAVAISSDGKVMVVTDDDQNDERGALWIYERDSDAAPYEVAYFEDRDEGRSNDDFGRQAAISDDGRWVVVGSFVDDDLPGFAEIFWKETDTWAKVTTIFAEDSQNDVRDLFGSAVAINGDGSLVALGAYIVDSFQGAVYVYERVDGNVPSYAFRQRLQDTTEATDADRFGWEVDISSDGKTIIAGAYTTDFDNLQDSGSVYVFEQQSGPTDYTQLQRLQAPDGVAKASGNFGFDCAISGDAQWIFGSAPFTDGPQALSTGGVAAYQREGNTYVYSHMIFGDNLRAGGRFGDRVDCDSTGGLVAVKAGEAQGERLYFFTRDTTDANANGHTEVDVVFSTYIDLNVSPSGQYVIAGNTRASDGPGSAFVFNRNLTPVGADSACQANEDCPEFSTCTNSSCSCDDNYEEATDKSGCVEAGSNTDGGGGGEGGEGSDDGGSSDNTAVIAGIIAGVAILLLAILGLIFYRRRRRARQAASGANAVSVIESVRTASDGSAGGKGEDFKYNSSATPYEADVVNVENGQPNVYSDVRPSTVTMSDGSEAGLTSAGRALPDIPAGAAVAGAAAVGAGATLAAAQRYNDDNYEYVAARGAGGYVSVVSDSDQQQQQQGHFHHPGTYLPMGGTAGPGSETTSAPSLSDNPGGAAAGASKGYLTVTGPGAPGMAEIDGNEDNDNKICECLEEVLDPEDLNRVLPAMVHPQTDDEFFMRLSMRRLFAVCGGWKENEEEFNKDSFQKRAKVLLAKGHTKSEGDGGNGDK
eukprot:Clim_evm19s10 gene=Clim_evmTU19s10